MYLLPLKLDVPCQECICCSGVRYRKIPYHDYCTLYLAIQYISRYIANHSACAFTLMTLVPLVSTMQHGTWHYTHWKVTLYNDILGTFLSEIYIRLISRYRDSISYRNINFISWYFDMYRISHITILLPSKIRYFLVFQNWNVFLVIQNVSCLPKVECIFPF